MLTFVRFSVLMKSCNSFLSLLCLGWMETRIGRPTAFKNCFRSSKLVLGRLLPQFPMEKQMQMFTKQVEILDNAVRKVRFFGMGRKLKSEFRFQEGTQSLFSSDFPHLLY